jgi:hypothetical protein
MTTSTSEKLIIPQGLVATIRLKMIHSFTKIINKSRRRTKKVLKSVIEI